MRKAWILFGIIGTGVALYNLGLVIAIGAVFLMMIFEQTGRCRVRMGNECSRLGNNMDKRVMAKEGVTCFGLKNAMHAKSSRG